MAKSFKRNVLIGFGFSLLLLIISSTASYISIRNLLASSRLVDQTNSMIRELEKINLLVLESESSQRGYLLVGDPSFLEPLRQNSILLRNRIGTIKKIVTATNNITQLDNINKLEEAIETRLRILEEGVRLKQEGKDPPDNLLIQGKQLMTTGQNIGIEMEKLEEELLAERTQSMQRFSDYTPILIVFAALISLLVTIVFYLRIVGDFRRRSTLHEELKQKDVETGKRLSIIREIAEKISGGNFKVRINDEGQDLLGNLSGTLNRMGDSLENSFRELANKEWLQAGVAGLNNKMLGQQHVEVLAHNILNYVVEYIDSKIGALYLVNTADNLVLTARVALTGKVPDRLSHGEGVVGQCAATRKIILLDDISDKGFIISFAVGEVKPVAVVAIPLIHDGHLKGVIALGSLSKFSENEYHFFESVSWQAGIAINSSQNHRRLQELLEETQSQSEELQTQHSELENMNEELNSKTHKLQVSEEELRAQQEELMRTNAELEERTTLLEERNELIETSNREIQRKAVELAQSTRYKSEFLANMSHELRTPLNSILLLSRLMEENSHHNLNEEQIEYARVIQSSGQGLLSLIDEILDLSKIESGKMDVNYRPITVREIVNNIRSLFVPVAAEKGIEFTTDIEDNITENIETDNMRLEQILRNLISNAIKFTSERYVRLHVYKPDSQPGMLIFSVKDSGIGISAEKHTLIFDAFRQADGSTKRQFGGTGLGLSISRELARLLGGEINLISEPGKGSEFRLIIPVNRPDYLENDGAGQPFGDIFLSGNEQAIVNEVADEEDRILGRSVLITRDDTPHKMSKVFHRIEDVLKREPKKVLIIEENPEHARALFYFLENFNIHAETRNTIGESMEALRKKEVNCVILDVDMSCCELCKRLEEAKDNPGFELLPIIIFTGKHLSKHEEVQLKQYANSIVLKTAHSYQRMLDEVSLYLHLSGEKDPAPRSSSLRKLGRLTEVLKNRKVLIADDDVRNIFSLSKALEDVGMKVLSAIDGKEALQQLADDPSIDIILMDMMMPGMDGYETMKIIRSMGGQRGKLPIIALTAKAMMGDREKCIHAGASDYITKPVDKDQLLSLLRVWLYDRN